jgi:hypothetical protein
MQLSQRSIRSLACLCLLAASAAAASPPAFPGAVGQGAAATGGRGGDVYVVRNLRDYDADRGEAKILGSLRHAIRSGDGPRTIVFNVSGAIPLRAPLDIRKSHLTIAGQTSPGGITVWGYPTEIAGAKNVIVRYLRCRTGDFHARGNKSHADNNSLDPSSANAVNVGRCERVILDHLSASWGIDETLSVTLCRDVTIQNCLIAESLHESFHVKGPHGYGSLIRGELTPEDQRAGVGGYTFYRNLWAHHVGRNPSIGGKQRLEDGQSEGERRRTDVNVVNNVVYNWGGQPTHRSELGDVRINMLANVYICGPAKKGKYIFRENTDGRTFLWGRGNWQDLDQDDQHDGALIAGEEQSQAAFRDFGEGDELLWDGEPFNFLHNLNANALAAEDAYTEVLDSVGASLWRDDADRRVVESVQNRRGEIIDSQEEVRTADGKTLGIDDLQVAQRPADFDADADGMADDFERAHRLDPTDPDDRNDTTLSEEGYTNLEVYVNSLVEAPPAYREGGAPAEP